MNTKHVFIVRHGESVANATGIRQGPETPLTERGESQAALIGTRLRDHQIERIVASPYARAHKTARIISEKLGMTINDVSPLFKERTNPSIMRGKRD